MEPREEGRREPVIEKPLRAGSSNPGSGPARKLRGFVIVIVVVLVMVVCERRSSGNRSQGQNKQGGGNQLLHVENLALSALRGMGQAEENLRPGIKIGTLKIGVNLEAQ